MNIVDLPFEIGATFRMRGWVKNTQTCTYESLTGAIIRFFAEDAMTGELIDELDASSDGVDPLITFSAGDTIFDLAIPDTVTDTQTFKLAHYNLLIRWPSGDLEVFARGTLSPFKVVQ